MSSFVCVVFALGLLTLKLFNECHHVSDKVSCGFGAQLGLSRINREFNPVRHGHVDAGPEGARLPVNHVFSIYAPIGQTTSSSIERQA